MKSNPVEIGGIFYGVQSYCSKEYLIRYGLNKFVNDL